MDGLAVLVCAGGITKSIGHHIVILGSQVEIHRGLAAEGIAQAFAAALLVDVRDVDSCFLSGGIVFVNGVIRVLQHHNGGLLGLSAKVIGLVSVRGGDSLFLADIGVVKQAHMHLDGEEAACGLPQVGDALLFAHILQQQFGTLNSILQIGGAADLIVPHFVQCGKPLGHGHIVHTKGAAIASDSPVGDDKAVKAVITEQIQGKLIKGVAHELAVGFVFIVENTIAGHQAGGCFGLAGQVERAVKEGNHMRFQVIAREYHVLAQLGVVITTALRSAGSHKVLDDGHHAVLAPTKIVAALVKGGLHPVDVGGSQIAVQGGVLTVGTAGTEPDGVGGQVNLRSQEHRHTHGAVLLGGLDSHLVDQLGVKGGSQSILTHDAGDGSGVGADGGGYAVIAGGLAQGLERVHPLSHVGGVARHCGAAAGAGTPAAQVAALNGAAEGAPTALRQHGGNFFGRQPPSQIHGPLLVSTPPVLIAIQLAVSVQILEGVAVHLNKLHTGVGGVAQGGAPLVGHLHPAVGCLLLGPLHGAGAQLLHLAGRDARAGGWPGLAAAAGGGIVGAGRTAADGPHQHHAGQEGRQGLLCLLLHFSFSLPNFALPRKPAARGTVSRAELFRPVRVSLSVPVAYHAKSGESIAKHSLSFSIHKLHIRAVTSRPFFVIMLC